ncbi:autotransporter assembly complex protein TamA [Marinospirillum celere]|uniref:autotransporter assembly complex protein TamA n=1 Tax=Marinospirillum celere TaxID=1122252 RepID=UPI001C4325EC|nr:autotransporter assembly complex family protein [Marinospirillum celere]
MRLLATNKAWLLGWGLLLLVLVVPRVGASNLELILEPENSAVRTNVEAYLGEVANRNTREMRRYARFARGEIEKALEALGYYNYQMELTVEEGDPARLRVVVETGEPVMLGYVSIGLVGEALQQPEFTLPSTAQLRRGQPLNHSHYESAKRHFRNQALTYGYFSSGFTVQELLIDPEVDIADITLHFDSGPRYRLGPVSFDHEGKLDEAFLQRFVRFVPGMPYSTQQLAELSRELRESGYFREVLVDADPDEVDEDLHVPVEVLVRARKPRTLNLGLGFSTDIGPRASAGWVQHWVNPRGLRRGVDTQVSEPQQSISGWYEFPLDPPMTDKLRISSSVENEYFNIQRSRRYGAAIQWFYRHSNNWERVLSLRGEREEFRVGEDDGATWLTLPGIGYGYFQGDRRVDPTRGYRLQIDVEGSRQDYFSDVDILQVTFLARGLTTLWDHHRFLARFRAGGTATNEFNRVPASLRFFAGGDQSVRGYGYQELAPEGSDGRLIGGRYLATAGLEYQYAFAERWRWAFFVDAGDAVLEPEDLQEPKVGVGTGIRWVSPVGPLRLDIAQGLDDDLGGWRIHFTLGPEI